MLKKEDSKVILMVPRRWLDGVTGGDINHIPRVKGNTVGGSTYKILVQHVKE